MTFPSHRSCTTNWWVVALVSCSWLPNSDPIENPSRRHWASICTTAFMVASSNVWHESLEIAHFEDPTMGQRISFVAFSRWNCSRLARVNCASKGYHGLNEGQAKPHSSIESHPTILISDWSLKVSCKSVTVDQTKKWIWYGWIFHIKLQWQFCRRVVKHQNDRRDLQSTPDCFCYIS